ncbi:MAG: GNAT family N-acetyltransferase [Proteobacteria bacterium]|nr:GNAT family N-acetyltransferase [Pseudomonadota bacterium]MCP4918845.1 GNAT family N-acetyltransferase [Pseudomonadota bacterium]
MAEDGDTLVGACLAGERQAVLDGEGLRLVHVGPIAVVPECWHNGVGTAMLKAVHQMTEADVATLTVNRVEDVSGFYARQGYRDVQFWTPFARDPSISPSQNRVEQPSARAGLLTELAPPVEPRDEPRVRIHRVDGAEVRTVLWRVTTRSGGSLRPLSTCQIVHRSGDGEAFDLAIERAVAAARVAGARLVWARPQLIGGALGFRRTIGPGVARMARPLSERGRRLFPSIRGWTPAGPSP